VPDLVYRTKITLREGYLRMLPFIEYSIIKNRNTLDKNKYINNIKYLGLPLAIPHLASPLYCFNSSYSYIRLRTRVITMNLVAVFALLISVNAYLYYREVDETLVPEFGVVRGTDPDVLQIGSCSGFNRQFVPIPCTCPPDHNLFINALNNALEVGNVKGEPITFSNDASDQSGATNKQRATACVIVLQSFNGEKGNRCPVASAPNFKTQQDTGI
jgi:hypothetical protein